MEITNEGVKSKFPNTLKYDGKVFTFTGFAYTDRQGALKFAGEI